MLDTHPAGLPDENPLSVSARCKAIYRRQDQAFRISNAVLGVLSGAWTHQKADTPPPPRRILLVNAGHLGDLIITSALLPVIRTTFPDAQIGVLTGGYSRPVLEKHKLVSWVHLIDHWYLSRSGKSAAARVWDYFRAIPSTVRELRAVRYDIAIDVRSWFPNLIGLLWLARIPVRVGYDRVGWGPLLTHRLRYAYDRHHELHAQLRLLREIGVSRESLDVAWPTLPAPDASARQEAADLLQNIGRYRVLHPISSAPTRDWPFSNWEILARDLVAAGVTPVITGAGSRDKAFADRLRTAVPGCIDAVGRLSWSGLVAVIAGAEAVYAVETSIGHVASALKRPTISIYGGMADPEHWAPLGATVVTNVLPCHPCFRKQGCATRSCIVDVTPQDVHEAATLAVSRASRDDHLHGVT